MMSGVPQGLYAPKFDLDKEIVEGPRWESAKGYLIFPYKGRPL